MQRLCTKLRCLAQQSHRNLSPLAPSSCSSRRLLHDQIHRPPLPVASSRWSFVTAASNGGGFASTMANRFSPVATGAALLPHHFAQVRHITTKDLKAKLKKKWKPRAPTTSKVKKIKMKSYSSYKDRFRTLNDGTIRRWRAGKRHNAHLKSKKSKRRLRKPALVPAAYAKVMKKLNFCG